MKVLAAALALALLLAGCALEPPADDAPLPKEPAASSDDDDVPPSLKRCAARPPAPPPPRTSFTPREFRGRFSSAEQDAIDAAAMADADVFKWRIRAAEAQEIHLDHAETIAGMDLLVSKGLITAQRKTEILTP